MLGQAAWLVLAYASQIFCVAEPGINTVTNVPTRIQFKMSPKNELALNDQINLEYTAMYTYEAMAVFFDSAAMAMPGCSQYFLLNANEEHEHTRILMTFMNQKGGRVTLKDIKAPSSFTWISCAAAMKDALELENRVRRNLDDLLSKAEGEHDVALVELLSEMILDQTTSIKRLGDIIQQFNRAGGDQDGLGHFLVDQALQRDINSVATPGLAKMPLDSLNPRSGFGGGGVAGKAF